MYLYMQQNSHPFTNRNASNNITCIAVLKNACYLNGSGAELYDAVYSLLAHCRTQYEIVSI